MATAGGVRRGMNGGWAGALLVVDLSRGTSERVALDRAALGEWLGGRGLATHLLEAFGQGPGESLGEGAGLLFLTGPLSGSPVPFSGKACLAAVSPLTGLLGYASLGGRLAPAIRAAGYDGVLVRGRAPAPCVVFISGAGEARIGPRPDLWGLGTADAARALGKAAVACIGPAGENQVRFACVVHEGHVAGRTGLGAVMGAKNLKALVVEPATRSRLPHPADEAALGRALEASRRALAENAFVRAMLEAYRALGTAVGVEQQAVLGGLPARNFSAATLPGWEAVSSAAVGGATVGRVTCHRCWLGCQRRTRSRLGVGAGPHYESIAMLGPNCGHNDLETVLAAAHTCNDLGLDTISAGGAVAFAMECAEAGLLPGGPQGVPRFGDGPGQLALLEDIAHRRGWGELLAEGTRRAAARLGGRAPQLAMQVKGLELPAFDPRATYGVALGLATSSRGGDHRGGNTYAVEGPGYPFPMDRFSLSGKAVLTVMVQDLNALLDSLPICGFGAAAFTPSPRLLELITRVPMLRGLPGLAASLLPGLARRGGSYGLLGPLLSAVTGEEWCDERLRQVAGRIFAAERRFNLAAGLDPASDDIPSRFKTEAIPVAGAPRLIPEAGMRRLVAEYYRQRGWSPEGRPPVARRGG